MNAHLGDSAHNSAEFDRDVRLHVYQHFVAQGHAPLVAEAALALGCDDADAEAAYLRLAAAHVLVLQPGSTEIWMAMPFSAIPTPFRVTSNGREWFANCAWDALGIPAMLGADAQITTTCPDCDVDMNLTVISETLIPATGAMHFALPPRRWWDDIGYT